MKIKRTALLSSVLRNVMDTFVTNPPQLWLMVFSVEIFKKNNAKLLNIKINLLLIRYLKKRCVLILPPLMSVFKFAFSGFSNATSMS